MWHPFGWFFGSAIGLIGLIISLALYFVPTIVAVARHHRNALAIFLLNLFLGWTFIAWIVTLVWAIVG
jgi:hypothetical protein